MTRVAAAAFAAFLFGLPVITAPMPVVVAGGLIGLLLAGVGIATLWRWPVTVAACIFLTDYAAALWLADTPVSVGMAAAFGLSLLLLLEAVELARSMRHATVDAGVVRSQIVQWIGFGLATLAVTWLAMPVAGALSRLVPFAAAPLVAAIAALGAVLALAAAVLRPRP